MMGNTSPFNSLNKKSPFFPEWYNLQFVKGINSKCVYLCTHIIQFLIVKFREDGSLDLVRFHCDPVQNRQAMLRLDCLSDRHG